MSTNIEYYIQLIESAKRMGYDFQSFTDIEGDNMSKSFLLRHDIDVDLEAAVYMAEVEFSLGIKSTYFLMLRSPVYNLLSRHNADFVNRIIDMGHYIGVHYDGGYEQNTAKDLSENVLSEARIISDIFNIEINAVSFHQPSKEILESNIFIDGLINTYNKEQMKGYEYISDSNASFTGKDPIKLINNNKVNKIQLLVHPMWWFYTMKNFSTEEIWRMSLINNLDKTQNQLLATERAYGEKSIFQIDEITMKEVTTRKNEFSNLPLDLKK